MDTVGRGGQCPPYSSSGFRRVGGPADRLRVSRARIMDTVGRGGQCPPYSSPEFRRVGGPADRLCVSWGRIMDTVGRGGQCPPYSSPGFRRVGGPARPPSCFAGTDHGHGAIFYINRRQGVDKERKVYIIGMAKSSPERSLKGVCRLRCGETCRRRSVSC
jgi:hypothetical protein